MTRIACPAISLTPLSLAKKSEPDTMPCVPNIDYYAKLEELRRLPSETEIVEFKEAKTGYDFDKLGRCFSALANEANLRHLPHAWLVFGVEDKKHSIVGTKYRENPRDLDHLKSEIADQMTERLSFRDIHEVMVDGKRVLMFEIPAAPLGIPIAFKGIHYGRDGSSLVPLNIEKLERIRYPSFIDWSREIIPEASLDDLDPEAIALARKNFKVRSQIVSTESDKWDDLTFLNKAKVTIQGKITRTAIVLLGKSESEHFLSPATKIRWLLKDSKGSDRDFHVETFPFLLAVDKIYAKIRNVKYRYYPTTEKTLHPQEIDTYEPFVIREAIHNCIAHQDYTMGAYINVVEMDDQLIFSNRGSFLPGSAEKVVLQNSPESHYRNAFLATAMYNLNMIEVRGGGIRKMFECQRVRFFPMPEYALFPDRVEATVIGKVLDVRYANILARNPHLDLEEIILLDKVQKKKTLADDEEKHLRKEKLIEGRKPNFFLAKDVAQKTEQQAEYSQLKGMDDQYYRDFLLQAIRDHGSLSRKQIDKLLLDKLPGVLSEEQKIVKITNILSSLRDKKMIEREGWSRGVRWKLINQQENAPTRNRINYN